MTHIVCADESHSANRASAFSELARSDSNATLQRDTTKNTLLYVSDKIYVCVNIFTV